MIPAILVSVVYIIAAFFCFDSVRRYRHWSGYLFGYASVAVAVLYYVYSVVDVSVESRVDQVRVLWIFFGLVIIIWRLIEIWLHSGDK